jgi:hypothetical protein
MLFELPCSMRSHEQSPLPPTAHKLKTIAHAQGEKFVDGSTQENLLKQHSAK